MNDLNDGLELQVRERRAFIRYPRRLEMLWQFLGVPEREMISAEVLDVSSAGAGLTCDRPFDQGTRLFIRLPTATQGWASHLVEVRHCKQLASGAFQIGCRFLPALKREQLAELLV